MPHIEVNGEQLQRIVDCPACGRTVLAESIASIGWLATCGRRLVNLSECRPNGCGDVDLNRRCDSNLVGIGGECIACGAIQGEACQALESRKNSRTSELADRNALIHKAKRVAE